MITAVKMRGFGPHEDATIQLFEDRTHVRGPSEIGKSALVQAVCFALWGRGVVGSKFDPALIRDGHDATTVELDMNGVRVARSFDRTKSTTRLINGVGYSSESKFAAALGAAGNGLIGRLVVAPMVWVELTAGNARPFRDALASILPAGDVPAEVEAIMSRRGASLANPGEARATERQISQLRRDTRRERDRTAGRVATLTERVEGLAAALANVPEVPVTRPSEYILKLHREWEQHDQALSRHRAEERLHTSASAAAVAWDRRHLELGPEPKHDSAAYEGARRAADESERRLSEAMDDYRRYKTTLDQARARLDELMVSGDPEICPTCKHRPWVEGVREAERRRVAVESATTALDAQVILGKEARGAREAAAARAEEARASKTRLSGWKAARAALGPRPVVVELGEPPKPPDGPRPSADQLGVADGAAMQRREDLRRSEEALAEATARLAVQQAENERLDHLLEAVRQAPSNVARAQTEALGDLGPVTLVFGDNPAIRVLVDGRPWWLASRGRQVVADACLRSALRRASGLDLPIFIDNAQDVAGQPLPELEAQVVVLRTVEADGLSVSTELFS